MNLDLNNKIAAVKYFWQQDFSKINNRDQLADLKRQIVKKFQLNHLLSSDLLAYYRQLRAKQQIKELLNIESLLRKRSVRTMSGIAPVAVLTKPYPCPGNCAYCPREKEVPVSYLSNEPAVMRAIRCQYDPYKQVILRLRALENNGHQPNKIELIVIGGTWSYLPTKYQYWYLLNCFKAANDYSKIKNTYKNIDLENNWTEVFKEKLISPYKQTLTLAVLKSTLKKEQIRNERAKYRLIGVTLETRPDFIKTQELLRMRELGCTRVEIGVQSLDDQILKLNKRGHQVAEIAQATKLLRRFGFKVTYHIMPGLPGSNPVKDLEVFQELFNDERWQPDQIKFYPTVVTKGSLLYRWYKQGKYQPYSDKELQDLIIKCKKIVPIYVRIIRLIRDIPAESIVAGNKITNLRQIMQNQGVKCHCIRCREAKEKIVKEWSLNIYSYQAAGGREYFISADSLNKKILYGFCRLRLDTQSPIAPAIVRELHVYGQLVPPGQGQKIQHQGLGKQLLKAAEEIARQEKIKKIAVISGVGVRAYYRSLGYRLNNTYMIKNLK